MKRLGRVYKPEEFEELWRESYVCIMMLFSCLRKASAVVFILSSSLFRWIFRISSLNTRHLVFHHESLVYVFQLNAKVLSSIRVISFRYTCIMNLIKGLTVLKVEYRCCWWWKRRCGQIYFKATLWTKWSWNTSTRDLNIGDFIPQPD